MSIFEKESTKRNAMTRTTDQKLPIRSVLDLNLYDFLVVPLEMKSDFPYFRNLQQVENDIRNLLE